MRAQASAVKELPPSKFVSAADKAKLKAKEEDENSNVQLWNVGQWLQSLHLHDVVAAAFSDLPEPGEQSPVSRNGRLRAPSHS